jgi:iron(III) transport system permease protein
LKRLGPFVWAHVLGVILALVVVSPLAWIGLRAWEGGAAELRSVLLTRDVLEASGWSVLLAGVVSALCVGLSVPLAWLTHATDVPGRRVFRRLVALPLAVPSFVSGFVVVASLGPAGPLDGLGLPEVYGLFGAVVALCFTYPYALIPVQAALTQVDPRTWEAARALGAGPARAFYEVVWPQIRPAAASGGALVALYTLGDFGAVSLLRYPSLSYLIYQRYSSPFMRREAVWYALALVALALVMVAVARAFGRQAQRARALGQQRAWPVVPLGRWRWPAFALCLASAGFGALLPVGVVGWWLVRGLRAGNTLVDLSSETLNSVWMAAGAAALITLAGLAPAVLGRFGRAGVARWVNAACYLGYALPGVVVALALVFMGTRALPWMYHTVWMLQLAYMVRFLPQASGALDDGLAAQNPRLYDAARALGCTPGGALWRVVLPAMLPAIAASALAVFLSVVKELPATLLLKPPGFSTLAQRIWSLTQDAFFTAASPTVLVLLGLALVALWLRPDSATRGSGEEARS